ncbi:hypothetical protein [Streptomyces sp. OE57]|uniref:hypothetical protein n=1 Tax=Streptomyces lacaronensis TaxID=3379885 RepID=UPI0039B74B2D
MANDEAALLELIADVLALSEEEPVAPLGKASEDHFKPSPVDRGLAQDVQYRSL